MTKQPRVSVVIPCYNSASFLRETLTSVLGQTYQAFEVIVVDDGSTDNSGSIVDSFGHSVRLVTQPNQGQSVARNRGIDEARGDWIALLDADDVWEPQKLQRQAEIVSDNPHLACVHTYFYKFDGGTKSLIKQRPDRYAEPGARVRLLIDWWCVLPSSAMIRRDICRAVRFPETVRSGEDVIFFALLHDYGRFHRIPEFLTGYRASESQQTGNISHWLRCVLATCMWFKENIHRYSLEERRCFSELIKVEIERFHDSAFWARQHADVRHCRAVFAQFFGPTELVPAMFRKPLYPAWVCRCKDYIELLLRGGHSIAKNSCGAPCQALSDQSLINGD